MPIVILSLPWYELRMEYQKIGPHWFLAVSQGFFPFICGLLLLIASYGRHDIAAVMVDIPSAMLAMDYIEPFAKWAARPGMGMSILGVISIVSVYLTTEYLRNEEILMVQKGIFMQSRDAIRFSFVADIDVQRSIWEIPMGTGTLILRMIDRKGEIFVPYVSNPFEIQKFILARAAKLRAIGTASQ